MGNDVEEVKQKADIVQIIGERVDLKKAGRNFKANCPFHNEKTPSFMVSPELGIYKCFGCGESGDVISFLEKYEGMDFSEALQYLAEKVGVELKPRNTSYDRERKTCLEINELAKKYYQYLLTKHRSGKAALNYLLSERGLKVKTLETFELGYSPTDPKIFESFFVRKKRISPKDLELCGLAYRRGNTVFDRFFGRVVFPLKDHRGNVVGFSGRTLPGASSDLAKYINTPETPIYHKSDILYALDINKGEIKKENRCVIVEGEIDTISPWQEGIKNIVAIKGSALTENQVRLISRFTKNLVFALDTDFAGNKAARRGIEIAQVQGMKIRVARLGKYKDPDEMARSDPDALKKALKNAVPVYDFIINSTIERYDLSSGEGVSDISRELVPMLSSIEDEITKAKYINIVAGKIGIPYESVFAQVEKTKAKPSKRETLKGPGGEAKKDRRTMLEENLTALVFLSDPKKYIDNDFFEYITKPVLKKAISIFINNHKNLKKFSLEVFVQGLPEEIKLQFSEIILKYSIDYDSYTPVQVEAEYQDSKTQIELIDLRSQQSDLIVKMKQYQKEKNIDMLRKMKVRFGQVIEKKRRLESENR
ncbi:MAG TPA: DNA primase [Patescibacteria group bacterium]|nr:DNA primase [Patescibacteria group bacterium]